jgi:hypothetical protein
MTLMLTHLPSSSGPYVHEWFTDNFGLNRTPELHNLMKGFCDKKCHMIAFSIYCSSHRVYDLRCTIIKLRLSLLPTAFDATP